MKLSEAIREGSKRTKQGNVFTEYDQTQRQWSACALGAAYVGVLKRLPSCVVWTGEGLSYLLPQFRELTKFYESPTAGGKKQLYQIITHLNDDVGWSREQIADWLESEGL